MERDQLRGNSNCRLLLGVKGVGKTTLLQCITIATAAFTNNVIPIYVDYKALLKQDREDLLPSEIICYACSNYGRDLKCNPYDIVEVMHLLRKNKIRILFIADEFQTVYSVASKIGGPIIAQCLSIGNSTDGLICAVLSGSSAAMRDLCYCHLSDDLIKSYPSYTSYASLNNSKYTILAAKPISLRTDFNDLCEHIVRTHSGNKEFMNADLLKKLEEVITKPHEMEQLYLACGGRYRLINDALTNPDTVIKGQLEKIEKLDSDPLCQKLWQALLDKVIIHSGGKSLDIWYSGELNWNEVQIILKNSNESVGHLYQLVDDGALEHHFTEVSQSISFSHPLHMLFTLARHKTSSELSFYDQVCLRWPYGKLGEDAEKLLLESLCEKKLFVKHFKQRELAIHDNPDKLFNYLRRSADNVLVLRTNTEIFCQTFKILSTRVVQPNTIDYEIFKEYPDSNGSGLYNR
jgi:hypothetical protein